MLTQFNKYVKAALLVRQQARRHMVTYTEDEKTHVGVKLAHAI
ncbi:hypothetical protein [Pseudoalteromonas sp. HL-AS1]|nr:hypothetical protein [Pseudoalteromonas sp. HL-AS1]WMS91273.1 hypothetical protein RB214_02320 [Pseudoalteromonas sp. HL-AS1]